MNNWRTQINPLKQSSVILEELISIYPDLEKEETKLKMIENFEKNMCMNNMENLNNENARETIESIYNNINNTIKNAHSEMIMLKTKREYKTNWWSKELGDIKRSILAIKKKFKLRRGVFRENDEYSSELKDLKREFRKVQRKNKRNKDKKVLYFIQKIGKNRNKKQFWNKIREYKQKELGGIVKIEIGLKLLEKHFKDLFGENKDILNEFQEDIVNQVNSHAEKISLESNIEEEFTIVDIEVALRETKNSKAIGLDGICPY